MFHSIEPASPAKFRAEPSSGLNEASPVASPAMPAADPQPVERVVTLRRAASAQSPLGRRALPEMAPQAIEKPRFAPENGAPFTVNLKSAGPFWRAGDRQRRFAEVRRYATAIWRRA